MTYKYRRVSAWNYEVIRDRDKKVIAYLWRGTPQNWHLVSIDGKTVIISTIGTLLGEAKNGFQAYADKRRGHL